MAIEAIAADIDGTITDETRKICISAIEALRKAEEKGIPTIIVICSAGMFLSIK